ncbi:putative elongator complex protein 2 [Cucumispora dikerogammari]|nr:putative elongator complex protein 2 [Cucumispora dikerogammari]
MVSNYTNSFNSVGSSRKPNTSAILNDVLIYISSNVMVYVNLNTKITNVQIYERESLKLLKVKNNQIAVVDDKGTIFINHKKIIKLDREIVCFDILEDFVVLSDFQMVIFINLKNLMNNNGDVTYIEELEAVTAISIIKYGENILSIFGKIDGFISIKMKNKTRTFEAHSDKINSLDVQLNQNYLKILSSSTDCTVKLHILQISVLFENTDRDTEDIELGIVLNHVLPVFSAKFVNEEDILTASADNSIIYYFKNKDTNEKKELRFGGLHAKNKNFYNSFLYENRIIGHSHTGGFYSYNMSNGELDMLVGGHQAGIRTLSWMEQELLTASKDGTARIWSNNISEMWSESSRPIIHGYYLNGAKFLEASETYRICCYSEEPIIRIYEPTKLSHFLRKKEIFPPMPEYAILSELSLTNEQQLVDFNKSTNLNEKTLSEMTLFNEEKKVYAHYFEVSTVCIYSINGNSKYLFSANISSHKKYAGIFVHNWEYEKLQYIECHQSTVNHLCVSNCGNYLLAVSKDKSSSLYSIENIYKKDKPILELIKHHIDDHKREVYQGAFSQNSQIYGTCGRDQVINIYSLTGGKEKPIKTEGTPLSLEFTSETTILVGFNDGILQEINLDGDILFSERLHGSKINDIKFSSNQIYLAIAGEDGCLRIFNKE